MQVGKIELNPSRGSSFTLLPEMKRNIELIENNSKDWAMDKKLKKGETQKIIIS